MWQMFSVAHWRRVSVKAASICGCGRRISTISGGVSSGMKVTVSIFYASLIRFFILSGKNIFWVCLFAYHNKLQTVALLLLKLLMYWLKQCMTLSCWADLVFSARCNIYISCLCYDASVRLSNCLWRLCIVVTGCDVSRISLHAWIDGCLCYLLTTPHPDRWMGWCRDFWWKRGVWKNW